jgi:ERCC4-related helicase
LSKFIEHPLLKDHLVLWREYQETIFINCLNHNCLVVIPTGLGKTIIALMLSVHRLTEYSDSKVIFLAPTKPLVNQHRTSFLDMTEFDAESLIAITGSTLPDKRKELWKDARVAFMTPQVLQNDIITNLYSIRDVSLIIFDECHRAIGDYSYCFIAQKYIELAQHHQILGLTASPGSTEQKIDEIRQNLFIDHVEIRTEMDSDVKPYIHDVENEFIRVKLPPEFLQIKKILKEKLSAIYKWLKQNDLLETMDVNKVSRKELLEVDKKITRLIASSASQQENIILFQAKKLAANAIRLNYMDELAETQGINSLDDYVQKNIEKIKQNKANKSLRELFSDNEVKSIIKLIEGVKEKEIFHPKLVKLREILQSQLTNDTNSRILVFCHFRDSVNNIVKFLKNDSLIKVHKFVGQQTKYSDKGLSQKKQIELLEQFREGIYNTLIGTSVAEEGLDIAECDLVIFYDVVPSAIRSIQRRGRTGRKKEGKVVILIAQDTRDEAYYWAEKRKEQVMKKSLKNLKESEKEEKGGQSSIFDFIRSEDRVKEEDVSSSLKDETSSVSLEIYCDSRETASPVVRHLSLMGVDVKIQQLQVADYIISDEVGIERKAAQDFTNSIKDGRLFRELIELKSNFNLPMLILEGDPFLGTGIDKNAIWGAISTILLKFGIFIYKTRDPEETATFLYQLSKSGRTKPQTDIKLRFEKKPIETSKQLEYIVAGIPKVNASRAKNLLKEFRTLQALFNADVTELVKVDNIGKKLARYIYKMSRLRYEDKP